ncbi:M48 family metalloprotease [Crocosphaera sp. UHCC 0190]|uniref:M56 family metallopeptidase n=1 Tax=Crocosphaera sp. UHCC 0190 TaxID=3110246 RepID=UPI002B2166F3|nr:M48 family metalloprotease [Crocosphaera sp. UHCC 0190]MEA5511679.1 M48 family metalloprotease [Crocosphaera sp. UHCC 0190]
MHSLMILMALFLAWGIRLSFPLSLFPWMNRWQRSLVYFLAPPLLLLMTAIAVILMGYHGEMLGWPATRFSYLLSIIFFSFAFIKWIQLTCQGWYSTQKIQHYPQKTIKGYKARILDITFPYSAQIGFWQPELVVSQGLLDTLDNAHLNAVIAHEQAHANYHDTFWFFWLGWLGRITFWLPHTETLWQDLLLLREMRADHQATQEVDPLILAESLLIVAQEINKISILNPLGVVEAAFHDINTANRLNERIEALFNESDNLGFDNFDGRFMLLTLLPLFSIPFHC